MEGINGLTILAILVLIGFACLAFPYRKPDK